MEPQRVGGALERWASGTCWSVTVDSGLHAGVQALVEAKHGGVLFVWRVPEG